MSAAHMSHMSAAGVKHLPEIWHITSMSSTLCTHSGSNVHGISVKTCGLRNAITKVGKKVWQVYGSSTNTHWKRYLSFCCACVVGRNFPAKLKNQLVSRSEVSPFSAPSGGLFGLKSTYGEISMYAVYAYRVYGTGSGGRDEFRLRARLGGDMEVDINGDVVAEDYYSVLGLTPDATQEEIKKAYYSCMKACHPDLSGDDPSITNFCSFINEIYEVLSDPEQRLIYDEINGYTLTATNPFRDPNAERDHAFVDEFACIGCKNCAHTAPESFEIEEEYGRARVISQSGNPVLVERAIQTCPVDCIYWTSAQQLSLLEDEMRRIERVNVGLMLAGMGGQVPDVFTQASWRWEKRQARAVERARVRMMKEGGRNGKDAWWNVNFNSAADEKSSKEAADKYARERAAKAAAAARRWREYSRRGVDRRAVRALAAETAAKAQEDVDKEKAGIN